MGQTCYLYSRLLLYLQRSSGLLGWRSLSLCVYKTRLRIRERRYATDDWSASRWPLPRRLVKSDRRKTADGEGHENRSSQEEDHHAARGYRILNRRQIHHQSYRIL